MQARSKDMFLAKLVLASLFLPFLEAQAYPAYLTKQDEWWNFTGWIDQGYCTSLQSPNWITLVEGQPTVFSILAYDFKCGLLHCNQTGEYCADCNMCRFYSGTPLVFRVTITDQNGNLAPATTCTVANYQSSAYGIYPVSCIARNTIAGTLKFYYVNLGFDPAYIPRDATLQQPIPSEILATTINTHPTVLFTAGPVNAVSCIGSWLNSISAFQAGEVAWYIVKQSDAFGNFVSENTGSAEIVTFNYKFLNTNKQNINVPGGVHQAGYSCAGCYALTFVPQTAGSYKLHLSLHGQDIQNAPAIFQVNPGPVNVSTSNGSWENNVNTFQLGSLAVFAATLYDTFQNLATVSSSYTLMAIFLNSNLTQLGNIQYTTEVDSSAAQLTFSFYPVWGVGSYYLQIGSSTEYIQKSPFSFTITAGAISVSASRGKWYNSVNTIVAGTTAYLTVEQFDGFDNVIPVKDARDIYKFSVSVVNYPLVMSMFFLNVTVDQKVAGNVAIRFKPTFTGQFSLHVGSEGSDIVGSPFPFIVISGPVYVPECEGSWPSGSAFVAGSQASFQVLQKDKQGNIVSVGSGSFEVYSFSLSASGYNKSISKTPNLESGIQIFYFTPTVAGNFTLRVSSTSNSEDIGSSPFNFSVFAGSVSVPACSGSWYHGRNQVSVYSKLELVLSLFDSFLNPVSTEEAGSVDFIAEISRVGSHVLTSTPDLIITPLIGASDVMNQLLLSFTASTTGDYVLQVGDGTHFIKGSGFQFSVFANAIQSAGGSVIQGAGLGNSFAGELSQFVIYVKDGLGNPTSDLADTLNVVITVIQSSTVTPLLVVASDDTVGEYIVTYNATVAGLYNIYVSWNDTVLAKNYNKIVFPGPMFAPSCTASGLGIYGGNAGDSLTFQIHLLDRFSNSVKSFQMKSFVKLYPDRLVSSSMVNGGNNGIISVKYTVALAQAEPYMLTVSVGYVAPGEAISGSPFSVYIQPGNVDVSMCKGEWQNEINTFTVGVTANFVIRQGDKNGNPVYAVAGSTVFTVDTQNIATGSQGTILKSTFEPLGNGSQEMLLFTFTMHEAGKYLLQVRGSSADLPGSFPFIFYPGQVSIANCTGGWLNKISTFRVGGVAPFIFVVRDMYGNLISASVMDLFPQIDQNGIIVTPTSPKIVPLSSSAQVVTFILMISGQFKLKIGDKTTGTFSTSYSFTYLSGDVYIPNCSASWSGGNQTFPVGTAATLVVILRDRYDNRLSSEVAANITTPEFVPKLYRLGVHELVTLDVVFEPIDNSNGTSYSLTLNIRKPGDYNLYVESDAVGILGSPFAFTATAGAPNVSQSLVSGVGLSSKASTKYWDEIDLFMKDSIGNPTVTNASLLTFEITGPSHVLKQPFVDMGGGKYVMFYRPLESGKFTISLSSQGHQFPGSPFSVTVGTLNGSSILEWPHISSTPDSLEGIEGAVVSCQRENSYFEVSFINLTASVTVEVTATHGRVFLPSNMYHMGSNLTVWPTDPNHPGDLTFSGTIGPSNQALLALLYQGDKLFNGEDVIVVTVSDAEGHEDTQNATVQLDPYNDPPFIDVPDAVKIATNKGAVVPPIVVGDPDNSDVDGQQLELEITLMVQGGTLLLTLPKHTSYTMPAELNAEALQTRPREVVIKSPHWKQASSFHFRAVSFGSSGIVFRATVAVCNDALGALQFEPNEGSGITPVLHIGVDDLGNSGCYGSCDSDVPYPLYAEANVTIVPFTASVSKRYRTIWGSTVGALGFVGIVTGLLVWVKQRYFRKLKQALQADEIEDEDYKELRTYNPIWKADAERAASILQPHRILKYAQHVADEVDGPDLTGPELVHVLQKRVSIKMAALPEIEETESIHGGRKPSMLGQVVGKEGTAKISYEYDGENYVRALNRTWAPEDQISGGTYTLDDANRPRLSVIQSSRGNGPNVHGQQEYGQGALNMSRSVFQESLNPQEAGSFSQPYSSRDVKYVHSQPSDSAMPNLYPPLDAPQVNPGPLSENAPSWEEQWGDETGWV